MSWAVYEFPTFSLGRTGSQLVKTCFLGLQAKRTIHCFRGGLLYKKWKGMIVVPFRGKKSWFCASKGVQIENDHFQGYSDTSWGTKQEKYDNRQNNYSE